MRSPVYGWPGSIVPMKLGNVDAAVCNRRRLGNVQHLDPQRRGAKGIRKMHPDARTTGGEVDGLPQRGVFEIVRAQVGPIDEHLGRRPSTYPTHALRRLLGHPFSDHKTQQPNAGANTSPRPSDLHANLLITVQADRNFNILRRVTNPRNQAWIATPHLPRVARITIERRSPEQPFMRTPQRCER